MKYLEKSFSVPAGPPAVDEKRWAKIFPARPPWFCRCQDTADHPKPGVLRSFSATHYNYECPACRKWTAVQKGKK